MPVTWPRRRPWMAGRLTGMCWASCAAGWWRGPGDGYWFTINYDGESTCVPGHPDDDQIMQAYHRDMDERVRYGRPAGESRTGRRLFRYLRAAGAPALAAGSSDWVVSAGPDGNYPGDEAYFLRSILNTIRDALRNRHDRVEPADLAAWLP